MKNMLNKPVKQDNFVVFGGNELNGEITIQTSKNATLPIMSALLLSNGVVTLHNCPDILDVHNMIAILKKMNVLVKKHKKDYTFNPQNASNAEIDSSLAKSMRSSLFLLGSTLSRFKTTTISMPGGCKIGKRPIDIHIKSLKKLNVKVQETGELVHFDATNARAARVRLRLPSVGATENLVQFACKLKGKTTILNPAREPEVVDLCNFLNLMGAKIVGAGTKKITIYGVKNLYGAQYTPMGDRIVAGTVLIAVALLGGKVVIKNTIAKQNQKLIEILALMGCKIEIKNDIISASRQNRLTFNGKISTGYYPKFPTDLQSLFLALATNINGQTFVKENVFENRFLIVNQLKKLGANIKVKNARLVKVQGVKSLHGAELVAQDLRGGAALVLAALASKGKSTIKNAHFIDRGYAHLEDMLSCLGANIKRE